WTWRTECGAGLQYEAWTDGVGVRNSERKVSHKSGGRIECAQCAGGGCVRETLRFEEQPDSGGVRYFQRNPAANGGPRHRRRGDDRGRFWSSPNGNSRDAQGTPNQISDEQNLGDF